MKDSIPVKGSAEDVSIVVSTAVPVLFIADVVSVVRFVEISIQPALCNSFRIASITSSIKPNE